MQSNIKISPFGRPHQRVFTQSWASAPSLEVPNKHKIKILQRQIISSRVFFFFTPLSN